MAILVELDKFPVAAAHAGARRAALVAIVRIVPEDSLALRWRLALKQRYEADTILMAKREFDGVYSADPELDAGAEFIPRLTHLEAIERGLKVMDTTALSLCMDNCMPICVFKMTGDNIVRVLSGEHVGTLVHTPVRDTSEGRTGGERASC